MRPRHFGEPVIEAGENGEYIGADQHIVDVGHHIVSVVRLPIHGNDAGEDTAQAADDQQRDRTNRVVTCAQ